ncbi:hypothetical protein GB937_010257 [Aspergillus fischeri]|nr:hypothetical protein GB937_010257 [Aspergillus fischeri]
MTAYILQNREKRSLVAGDECGTDVLDTFRAQVVIGGNEDLAGSSNVLADVLKSDERILSIRWVPFTQWFLPRALQMRSKLAEHVYSGPPIHGHFQNKPSLKWILLFFRWVPAKKCTAIFLS